MSMSMSIEELLDELENVASKAWHIPFSNGRYVINGEKIFDLIDDIKASLPQELKQAAEIKGREKMILLDAKASSEMLVQRAEEKAKSLLSHEEIVKKAKLKAHEIIMHAHQIERELLNGASNFINDIMSKTENSLNTWLLEVKQTRQSLKSKKR